MIFKIRNESATRNFPIVFLHGAMCDGSVWLMLSEKISKALPSRKSYLLNLPGRGKNSDQKYASVDDLAESVIQFIRERQIEKGVLVGHSMGGAVAQAVAVKAEERVEKLVLLASGLKFDGARDISRAIQRDFAGAISMIVGLAFSPDAPASLISISQKQMFSIGQDTSKADFDACALFDYEDKADKIKVPTIVCSGSLDRLTTPALNQRLARKIRGAYFELPNTGHMLHVEAADRLAPIVCDFVN